LSTVVIWVADLNKSAEFYKDLFEAESYYITDGFASVKGNGNEVLLHLLPEQYRSEPSIGEDNPIKPVFKVSSIDASREVALKHSCSFKADSTQHGDVTYLDGKDPDGHVIQVATYQK
jgi:catechol 2,3-dioxygenase-like lactoylglutathione lyase family enzyme